MRVFRPFYGPFRTPSSWTSSAGWRGRRELAPRCSATRIRCNRDGSSTEIANPMRATPDVARAGPTSARRRRERRFRSFFRHEQMAVKIAVVSAQHHSAQRCCTIATQTDDSPASSYAATAASPMVEYMDPAPVSPASVFGYVAPTPAVTYAAPAPVVGYVAPAPAVTYVAPAPVIDYVASAPSVSYAAPAPVFKYVAPAPVFGFVAPAPAGSFVAPSLQLRPAYTDDAAVVVSASQFVGSLPHGEVFSAPVFHQVHHVPLAGGGIPENLVDLPVVPEQVDFLRVVARRPPPLVDVMPSSRAHRHIMEDLGELAPSVQLLDLPVLDRMDHLAELLNLEEDVLDAGRLVDRFLQVPELVIAVPKISLDVIPLRTLVPEPQLADQLVEVPTVLTPTRIAVQIAEQIVATPVPRGRVRGSLPGQSSTSSLPESIEWVEFSDANGRTYFWNRRTNASVWKTPPGVRVVWVGAGDEIGGFWFWHRLTRATTYLLPPLPPE